MKTVELYARVRHAVLIEGISERAAADRFGINARTISKMLTFSVPPGYVRTKAPFRLKLDAVTGVIDAVWTCFTLVESILVPFTASRSNLARQGELAVAAPSRLRTRSRHETHSFTAPDIAAT